MLFVWQQFLNLHLCTSLIDILVLIMLNTLPPSPPVRLMFSKTQLLIAEIVNVYVEEEEPEGSKGDADVKLANVESLQLRVKWSARYRNDFMQSEDVFPYTLMFRRVSIDE